MQKTILNNNPLGEALQIQVEDGNNLLRLLNRAFPSSAWDKNNVDWEMIESIIDKTPADSLPTLLQIENKYGDTLLNLIVKQKQWEMIESIIDKTPADSLPALLQIRDRDGHTLLNLIVKQNKWEMIESIIDKTPADSLPALLQIHDLYGATPLLWAVAHEREAIVKLIIDKVSPELLSVLLQIQNKEEDTLLNFIVKQHQWEIKQDQWKMIELIINKTPADSLPTLLHIRNREGDNLLNLIVKQNKWEMIESIIDKTPAELLPTLLQIHNKNVSTPLHLAIVYAREAIAKSIIDKISPELLSVLLQLGNRRGDSLLHLAVTYNQDAIAKLIIDKISPELLSVLLQLGNRRGDSLLHLAVTYNQDAIAKLIIDKISPELLSVLLQLQNREGANLLSVLAKHNQWEIMIETQLELIESIMDKIPADLLPAILQIQDNYGNTVLHVAISSGNEKIIESIMDKIPADLLPALLQIQGKYVNTVLHVAIRSGNEKIIKSIIDKIPADLLPALLQIQDKDGNTLLNLLVEDKWEINQDKWEMIESIMDKFPADLLPTFLQIRTRDGHNLLSLMVRQNKWEMIKSIMDKIPADLLPDFLSELSIIAIGIKSPTSLNMLEEALNYTIHSETKFFNINSISVDGERIIDIAQKLYTHTQKPSVLKLINDLRIAGSVEPKEKIVWKEAIEENINLKELDSSIENKKITRKVLTRLDGYNLLEEQIDNNINWLKAKGIDNCVNTEWTHGIIFTVPQIIDKLSEDNMRQVDDRLGVNWDFKKVLATIIYIARISDDQSMSDNLIGTLSELNMCDLGKLMHLVYVVQTKFINDMEAAQKSIEYSENEISFLFQNTFDGLKNELGGDENKIAQAIKTWVLELTDDAVARKAPEQWSFTTLKVHGLFNSGLIVLINNKNLNYDSSHFIFLRNNVIEPMIDSITTSQAIELSGIINEWHKLYIHSKNLYFQQEFDKIVEAPDSMEGVFENFTLSPHSYYGVLKGIDLNVFAKFYKKLLDKGDEYAKNFIKIAQEYEFLNPEQIHAVQVSSEEPSLFDGDIAIAMQASRSFAREDKKKDEEKKDGGKERDDAITTYLFTAADEHNDDSIHPAGATVIGDLD